MANRSIYVAIQLKTTSFQWKLNKAGQIQEKNFFNVSKCNTLESGALWVRHTCIQSKFQHCNKESRVPPADMLEPNPSVLTCRRQHVWVCSSDDHCNEMLFRKVLCCLLTVSWSPAVVDQAICGARAELYKQHQLHGMGHLCEKPMTHLQ